MVSPDRIEAMKQAVEQGDLKRVKLLMKAGVPADTVFEDYEGGSLSGLAAMFGCYEIFCELIAAGASYFEMGKRSLLATAATSRTPSLEIIGKILSEGQPTQKDLDYSLLVCCVECGEGVIPLLLDAGANVNAIGKQKDTPLLHSVLNGRSDVAIQLFQRGAKVDVRVPAQLDSEVYKLTVIEVARKKGMDEFLRIADPTGASSVSETTTSGKMSVAECWQIISQSLKSGNCQYELPDPATSEALAQGLPLLSTSFGSDLHESYCIHNGSGLIGLIPMADDITYELMPFEEALASLDMLNEVANLEKDVSWIPSRLPFAQNGGGDYLLLDRGHDQATGAILCFSHETRETKLRAGSFLELMQDIATGLQKGRYEYSDGAIE